MAGQGSNTVVFVMDKTNLYAGGVGTYTNFVMASMLDLQPSVNQDANSTATYLMDVFYTNAVGSPHSQLRLYSVTGPAGSPVLAPGAAVEDAGVSWLARTNATDFAPQLGSTNKIQCNDDKLLNVVYRNGHLWTAHTVFFPTNQPALRSSIQWWEIDPATTSIVQRSTIDDPAGQYFYAFPSIGVNASNDVLIGYSRFSAGEYAAAAYSFRAHDDPPDQVRSNAVLKAGLASYYKTYNGVRNRWGDYGATVVDPANDLSFWTIQEFAQTGDNWGTWIGRLDAPVAGIAWTLAQTVNTLYPVAGSSCAFTVVVSNSTDAAVNTTVLDVLSSGLSNSSYSATMGSLIFTGTTGTWSVGLLPACQTATLTLNCAVGGSTAGQALTSVASVGSLPPVSVTVVPIAPSGIGIEMLVSRTTSAVPGNASSRYPAMTPDGRYTAFLSWASDLVPYDTNFKADVFVYDRLLGAMARASVSLAGNEANGDSDAPAISADGQIVAFGSAASNLALAPADTNGMQDLFVKNMANGAVTCVSVLPGGASGPGSLRTPFGVSLSANGLVCAYEFSGALLPADTNGLLDIYVYDFDNGSNELISVGLSGAVANGESRRPALSADGRYVTFDSQATNLVAGDSNSAIDVFVYDRTNHTTSRISVSSAGTEANADSVRPMISANGRFVVYDSAATNLTATDTFGKINTFLRDLTANTTTLISATPGGAAANADGQLASVSSDGRYLIFDSDADNMVANDGNFVRDVFYLDRTNVTIRRVSLTTAGTEANAASRANYRPLISDNGRWAAFESDASNLTGSDNNGATDVFVRDMWDDFNGNGVPDQWELQYFGATNVVTATSDHDGDGLRDVSEYLAGTDPTNRASTLIITVVTNQRTQSVTVKWPSVSDRIYGVRISTNLNTDVSFSQVLATGQMTTAPTNTYLDTGVSGVFKRFYRVIVEAGF